MTGSVTDVDAVLIYRRIVLPRKMSKVMTSWSTTRVLVNRSPNHSLNREEAGEGVEVKEEVHQTAVPRPVTHVDV